MNRAIHVYRGTGGGEYVNSITELNGRADSLVSMVNTLSIYSIADAFQYFHNVVLAKQAVRGGDSWENWDAVFLWKEVEEEYTVQWTRNIDLLVSGSLIFNPQNIRKRNVDSNIDCFEQKFEETLLNNSYQSGFYLKYNNLLINVAHYFTIQLLNLLIFSE